MEISVMKYNKNEENKLRQHVSIPQTNYLKLYLNILLWQLQTRIHKQPIKVQFI